MEELTRGKGLHEMKCAKCHRLYDPAEYDEESWRNWMGKMRKKAHLSDEQYHLISSYLDSLKKKRG